MTQSALTRLPGSPGCFICDNNASNPRSLRLELYWDDAAGELCIPCAPDETWCGFSEVVHGGLIATVLDEAMAWAVNVVYGDWAFTAEYTIRYKKPVTPGCSYEARARVTEQGRRKILAEARLVDDTGTLIATASAVFLPAKGKARPRTE